MPSPSARADAPNPHAERASIEGIGSEARRDTSPETLHRSRRNGSPPPRIEPPFTSSGDKRAARRSPAHQEPPARTWSEKERATLHRVVTQTVMARLPSALTARAAQVLPRHASDSLFGGIGLSSLSYVATSACLAIPEGRSSLRRPTRRHRAPRYRIFPEPRPTRSKPGTQPQAQARLSDAAS